MWKDALEAGGKILEIIGIVVSGSELFSVRFRQAPLVLLHALWRGPMAKDAAFTMTAFPAGENKLGALQGIAFILAGLIFQASPFLWDLLPALFCAVFRSS
jgi:hypothetical protein